MSLVYLAKKNILYFLSLINVGLGFLVYGLWGWKFGFNEFSDSFFFFMAMQTILLPFVQMFWESFPSFYMKERKKGLFRGDVLITQVFFVVMLSSLFVGAISQTIIQLYFFDDILGFFDFFCFSFVVKSIQFFLIQVLVVQGKIKEQFYSDIVPNFFLVFILFMYDFPNGDITLYYSVSLFFIVFIQVKVFCVFNFNFSNFFNFSVLKMLFYRSIVIKFGSVLYSLKDYLLGVFFQSAGDGLYSLYSLMNKIMASVYRVTSVPIMSKLVKKFNSNYFEDAVKVRNKVLRFIFQSQKKMVALYFGGAFLIFATGVIGGFFFEGYKSYGIFDIDVFIYFLFGFLVYLIVLVFYPYYHYLNSKQKSGQVLFSHFLHFIVFGCGFYLSDSIYVVLVITLISQFVLGYSQLLSCKKLLRP